MTEKVSTHFTKQNEKEKISRFFHLEKNSLDVVLWEKGSDSREEFTTVKFDKDTISLIVVNKSTTLKDKKLLFSFIINGVNYFGQCELHLMRGEMYKLTPINDLYKSERRDSFRLLTYPHYEAYIYIPQSEDVNIKKSNVVSLKTGRSETGLFKNFLEIVDQNNSDTRTGFSKFRILDISVTGLSFQVGEYEKEYLDKEKILKPIHISFKEEVSFSSAEIRYIVPLVRSASSVYKVGVQFLDVDTTTDQKLGKLISSAMRSFENDFEDFLK